MRQQYNRTEKKLFRTTIVWGDFPEDEGPTTGFNQVEEYVFKTENELEIFLSGWSWLAAGPNTCPWKVFLTAPTTQVLARF